MLSQQSDTASAEQATSGEAALERTKEAAMYDLLIRNARILDGTGSPAYDDLGIVGEQIVALGWHLEGEAGQIIEAKYMPLLMHSKFVL